MITPSLYDKKSPISELEIIRTLKALKVPLGIERPSEESFYRWISTSGPSGPSIGSCLSDLQTFTNYYLDECKIIFPDLLPCFEILRE